MISLIPSPTLHNHLAKGHPGAKTAHPPLRDSMCGPHFPVRRSLGEGGCSMKISEDFHQYAAEEALGRGMEEKSEEFVEIARRFM